MATLGERLASAISDWAQTAERQGKEGPTKMFQGVMADRLSKKGAGGKAGASYRALLSYLNGESEPTLEWLREAANILGVRTPWLLLDQEPRTEEEELARKGVAAVADARKGDPSSDTNPSPEELNRAFLEGLPALSQASRASWHAVGELYSSYTWYRMPETVAAASRKEIRRAKAENQPFDPEAAQEVRAAQLLAARQVAEMVGAGAVAGGVELEKLWRWELDRYIQTTTQALAMLCRPASPRELRAPQDRIIKGDSDGKA